MWHRVGRLIGRAIVALDLHLTHIDTWLNRGSLDRVQSTPLISRVIMVEIKRTGNASEASDLNPTTIVSKRFKMRVDVSSFLTSIDLMDRT